MDMPGQLFQTQDAIHSYKIPSQLKKRQRKIHIRICLENVLKCQEKERAESKVLSQLQCEEEQEREFCHWRLDDNKTNAHCSSEQNKERQDNKEGNQQPCACDMELETLRNALIQLSEEQKEFKRELSKLAKDRRLETEISSNCLCLPKEIQMEQQKLNSESQGHVQKGSENLIENQIECRLKMLESQVSQLKQGQEMHKIEIQHSKEFCVERLTHRETQQYELSKTVDSMKEAIEGISLVIAHTHSLAHTPVTRPSSEGSSMENLPRDAELKESFPP
ncbi:uncharacterized protein RHO17_004837 isoform 4-T4 [Thomomys bottae]